MTIDHATAAVTPAAAVPVDGVVPDHPDTVAAEHWLAALSPAPVLASTHLIRSPRPHVTLSLVFAGDPPEAVAEHVRSGRAVRYPGVELLVGTLTVAEVLALSAIAAVEVLGSGAADPAALLDTGGFVRPHWRAGVLTLTTTPAAGGRLVPFETRYPTPCCAAH